MIGMLVGMIASFIAGGAFPPLSQRLSQLVFERMPTTLPGPSELVEMRWRKEISEELYRAAMKLQGYDEGWSEHLFQIGQRVLTADMLVRAKWRGIIKDEEEYYALMRRNHLTRKMADYFEKVSMYFPSPGDLIRFAVREVYTPDIVEKYGMMEDLPKKFLEEAKKAGLPEEQARNYWAAHWVLPSVEQGFEMLHRGVIDKGELETLLRTLDIMPYWRDKLIQISYSPFTRVDVRRMADMQILDYQEVIDAYKDIGYPPEKAQRLADFTMAYYIRTDYARGRMNREQAIEYIVERGCPRDRAEEIVSRLRRTTATEKAEKFKELTEAKLRQAFMERRRSDEEIEKALRHIGYDEEDASLIIALWEDDRAEEELKETIDTLVERFVYGNISQEQFADELNKLNLPSSTADRIFRRALREKLRLYRLPSRTDLARWYKKKIIDSAEWVEGMRRLGYSMEDIRRYAKDYEVKLGE